MGCILEERPLIMRDAKQLFANERTEILIHIFFVFNEYNEGSGGTRHTAIIKSPFSCPHELTLKKGPLVICTGIKNC